MVRKWQAGDRWLYAKRTLITAQRPPVLSFAQAEGAAVTTCGLLSSGTCTGACGRHSGRWCLWHDVLPAKGCASCVHAGSNAGMLLCKCWLDYSSWAQAYGSQVRLYWMSGF